ncbi:hypothetical protein ACJ7Z2_01315 [Mannheimia glucosida]|uniref:hypothetical protein n=1 Tax=Mannheimia glucosida TaxID=85401 RepID=UPI003918110D
MMNDFIKFSTNPIISTLDVAKSIGKVIETNYFDTVQTLIPKIAEKEYKNSYSGNYGLGEFPFHTDMAHWYIPPKYLLLRCIVPAPNVPTNLINLYSIFQEIDFNYDLAHFVPRKKLESKTSILHLYKNGICRWDILFLKPFNQYARNLELIITDKISNYSYKQIQLKQAGDCILINNWKMIHSRSAVDELSLNRCYERVYLSEVF